MTPSSNHFVAQYALEVGVLTSGKINRTCRAHRREVVVGDVWLSGLWEPHGFEELEGPCSAVVVSIFPPMLATSMFSELPAFDWLAPFMVPPERRPSVPLEERRSMLELAHELTRSQELAQPRRSLVQRLLVYQILLSLPRVETSELHPPLTDDYGRVHPAIDLVLRNKRYVKSAEAAKACGMTVRTFNRSFQRVVGVSFHIFSARQRLQGAAMQLLESLDPIKAVAHAWGFFDASHFHQAFRAAYGCSPALYRRTGVV
jgi:AraC-like DNA-binding protein